MTPPRATDGLTPLGRTGWMLWPDAALRGAGFPAGHFLDLCDDELAAAADGLVAGDADARTHYAKVFGAALDRLGSAMQRLAAEPAFREAITWQNPGLVALCLDRAVQGRPRDGRGRQTELTLASYLQRYSVKNDSIGFFGPIGWARLTGDDTWFSAVPGPELLARRQTYFENWAVDGVAEHIAARPEAWLWLRPRLERSATLRGRVLRMPLQRPTTLSTAEVRLLRQCDGTRSIRDIAGDPPDPTTVGRIVELGQRGVLRTAVTGPLELHPETTLAAWIDTITDAPVAARARATLDELLGARCAVAAAAGDPARLRHASAELAATFERITGREPTRRSGRVYAGRTLVYEDAIRGTDVRIGRRTTDLLAPALGLVLDSATWLANAIGARFEQLAGAVVDREQARTGRSGMPLLQVMAAVMPEFLRDDGDAIRSDVVDEIRAEFQQRWSRAVGLPASGPELDMPHRVSADAVRAGFVREFPASPPAWRNAGWHSPDVMICADGPQAFSAGDVEFVLGELHCGCNTLESSLFPSQHPHPERLRGAAAASGLDGRIVVIPRMGAAAATSRMSRAAELMLPSYTYVSIGPEAFDPPAGAVVHAAQDLTVHRDASGSVVVRHDDGAEHPFLETIGEMLAALTTDAFRPVGKRRHRPRLTIDRLIVSREQWSFRAARVQWAFCKDEAERFAMARRWRAEHGLPERGFASVPVERKPTAVDFRSLPLVNILAKSIRRTADAGRSRADVTISEMLPDLDRLWLEDGEGQRYTAELRMVAVHPR